MYRQNKRSFTLLEVLISFLLIVIAAIPLLAPYPHMFKQQKKFIRELEYDRLASIYFVDLQSKILKHEIDPYVYGEKPIETKAEATFSASYLFSENKVDIIFKSPVEKAEYKFTYFIPDKEEPKDET